MKRIKLNQGSEEVGKTDKEIAISLTVGLNIIIFTWFFSSQGLQNKLSIKMRGFL